MVDAGTGGSVPAEFWQPITDRNLADWEAHWRPAIQEQMVLLNDASIRAPSLAAEPRVESRNKHNVLGSSPGNQNGGGDGRWRDPGDDDRRSQFRPASLKSKLVSMVYVNFLEVAPWNRKTLTGGAPRYVGIGTLLIGKAIESVNLGSRTDGLHSLPQSNNFRANQCGMRDLGSDANYNKLRS